jgi:glycosyltransferase involved in cell wall biosynthesis
MARRVLVVAMLDSIHTARWLRQFVDEDVDFLLFPSSPHRKIRPELQALLASGERANYRITFGGRWFALPLWFGDKVFGNFFRSIILRFAIHRFRPDLIHALELQNAGYLVLDSLPYVKESRPKVISTNWGSDIYWFRRFKKHELRLRNLLEASDFYSAECRRDVNLALDLGFSGEVLPVIPNAGGFEDELLSRSVSPLRDRNVIAIKGYHGWVGRAKIALGAVEMITGSLAGMEIVIYSANKSVARMAKRISKRSGLRITSHKKGELNHSQMLALFASSKIYVGLSESDGISTSLLESMAMGAIPVQTSTSCCDEWFQDSGVSVSEISVSSVASAILQGLSLAGNQANSDKNREIIRQKANARDVFIKAKVFYQLD